MKHLLYGVLAILCPVLCLSQIPLHGTVLSADKEPVTAATVTIKGTRNSTSTASDGSFTLMYNPASLQDHPVLLVTAVGYEAKELSIKDATPVTITLTRRISELDEALVIAYGKTTRRLNTGSVSRITANDISTQPVANPLAALQGRVPGLLISQATGLPGSDFSVLIRGRNSIQQGTAPLVLIDGVPFAEDKLVQRPGSLNTGSPFNTINPLDILSIEVLKDADATAIYGSRGANGVILITTKKGIAGKLKTEAAFTTGWGRVTRTLRWMDTPGYIRMRKEAFVNDGFTPNTGNAPDLLAWDTTRYTDWQQLLIGGTARYNNAQCRISAGNQQLSFTLSAGYNKETTVFPGNNSNRRGGMQLALHHLSPDQKWNMALSASYTSEKSNLPKEDLTQFIALPPNAPPVYDSAGGLNWQENGFYYGNPLAILRQSFNTVTDRVTGSLNLGYKILPGLQLRVSAGYNGMTLNENSLIPASSQIPLGNPKGSASFGNSLLKTVILEPQLEYTWAINDKHRLSALAGGSWQRSASTAALASGTGYTNDALIKSITAAATVTNAATASIYKYAAIFGRINYNISNRYLLNLTGRRDASSRFGPGRQMANFGAAGAAYIFSEANWIKQNVRFLSFGKLRGSIGITGNDQIGNYQYLDSWGNTQYTYQALPALRPLRIVNDQYSWEQNRKWEAALELGCLQDRIYLSVNWFRNRSDNQLVQYTLPSQAGFTSITRNFPAVVQNTGWEGQLTTTNLKTKSLEWNMTFNITIPKNKLLSFPDIETSSYANNYGVGQPLNIRKGFTYLGIDPQTGVYRFADSNNDGLLSSLDYSVLGTTDPSFYGGWQHVFTYSHWELQCFFQFVKQKGIHAVYGLSTTQGGSRNEPVWTLNRWQKPGDETAFQKYSTYTAYTPAVLAAGYMAASSAVLTDASFIRFKNLSITYRLSENLCRKMRLQSARCYLQAQNLFTITGYMGADPERQSFVSLPPLRMLSTGIQFTL